MYLLFDLYLLVYLYLERNLHLSNQGNSHYVIYMLIKTLLLKVKRDLLAYQRGELLGDCLPGSPQSNIFVIWGEILRADFSMIF